MSRYLSILLIISLSPIFGACKGSKTPAPQDNGQTGSTSQATDVNFIGGGTQERVAEVPEDPYVSPMTDPELPQTMFSWVNDIEAAKRMAQRDRKIKIVLWFTNPECSECLDIESSIFTEPDVVAASKGLLFVKMDTSIRKRESEYYLASGDPPALMFLDGEGQKYQQYFGMLTKEQLITMLTDWR